MLRLGIGHLASRADVWSSFARKPRIVDTDDAALDGYTTRERKAVGRGWRIQEFNQIQRGVWNATAYIGT
jgi:hypothetical protein